MKIWQRYLFGQLLRAFFFFLICILTLYIAVDFSMHGVRFLSKETTSWLDIGINYLRHFAKFAHLFLSLAFLLSMLRVLLDLNTHREISAFQTGGISTKKLLSPFFVFAAMLSIASYANSQWIAPDAQRSADDFYKIHSSTPSIRMEKVYSADLQDGSELVYRHYNWEKKELRDVFWIRSFNEIWHIDTLSTETPVAFSADHFIRNEMGILEKSESYAVRLFPEIKLENYTALARFISFENRSLSSLFQQAKGRSADKQKSAAHLHYKLALPLLPFLSIFAIAPAAIRFSRGRSSLLFIACSLFAYVGLMTLLDALLILAENQVLPAAFAVWGAVILAFASALALFSRIW